MKKNKFKRYRVIVRINQITELPMIILGVLWLVLLMVELIWQLSPYLSKIVNVIWAIFILDFIFKLVIAPSILKYLRKNIITMISLFIPFFRVFRIFTSLRLLRSLGFVRSLRMIRVVGSLNRGMRILGIILGRRGFAYILLLTVIVCFISAAAIYSFERDAYPSYWEALYWTAMMLTSVTSGFWPVTVEGKILAFLLALYSLGVLGYFTATLASFFLGQDAENKDAEIAGAKQIEDLIGEVRLLREEMGKGR
jgi:voltage-gated potassium channel